MILGVRDFEAEMALSERDEWPSLLSEIIDRLDLPSALNLLSLTQSIWQRNQQDLLSSVRIPEDSAVATVLHHPNVASQMGRPIGRSRGTVDLAPTETNYGTLVLVPDEGCFQTGTPFMLFVEDLDKVLRRTGASPQLAALVASALIEMASNAVEHSNARYSPIVSFWRRQGEWAFSITDLGRGLRSSLSTHPRYACVGDKEAMQLCLKQGVSRFDERGRGTGFTTLFRALADRMVELSLRSGSTAGEWSGTSPTAQKLVYQILPPRIGFHLEVRFCPLQRQEY